jgi:hypothetical protein
MVANSQSDLSCFQGGKELAVHEMKERLFATERLTKVRAEEIVNQLIYQSESSWRTAVYDGYQYCCQGIF